MFSISFTGRLTKDPVSRQINGKNGPTTVCELNVATDNPNRRDETMFFRVSVFGKPGEACQQYLSKGRMVAVTASSISNHAYLGQDGQPRGSLELIADRVEFLGSSGNGNNSSAAPAPARRTNYDAPAPAAPAPAADNDLPF